jgi:hypothetical protein
MLNQEEKEHCDSRCDCKSNRECDEATKTCCSKEKCYCLVKDKHPNPPYRPSETEPEDCTDSCQCWGSK